MVGGFFSDLPILEDDLETSGSDYPLSQRHITLIFHFPDATTETQAPQVQVFSDTTQTIRNNFTHTHTHTHTQSEPRQQFSSQNS